MTRINDLCKLAPLRMDDSPVKALADSEPGLMKMLII